MERDSEVFLPEWQGWRNGAAKCMDEGGEGGEGRRGGREGREKKRERGEVTQWEGRKESVKKRKIRFWGYFIRRRRRCGQRKSLFFLIDHIVCLFELPLHNRTHTHTHTHTHTAMITILHITGVQITAWLPTGLPIHCNPSNTLNFHFKQKLNRQKTQGSILSPPLFFPPASCFFFFFFFWSLPSSRSNHLFNPFCVCEIQYIRTVDDARAKRANRKSPNQLFLK